MYGQKSISQSLLDAVNTAMFEDIHPQAQSLLKHIKPEHHAVYKPFLAKKVFNGSHKDRTDVLNAAKQAGHLVSENIEEGFKELMQDVRDRAGPQPKGHIGQRAGTRYGGAGQRDDEREKETERLEKKKKMKKESFGDFKDRLIESLKGNQHKIDKNKNNKIDAHDFKLLRVQKEEVEIDPVIHPKSGKEIGIVTKQPNGGGYHALHSAASLAHKQTGTFDSKDKAHQFIHDAHAKAIKNNTLSDKFLKKNPSPQLSKEEVEELDEMSNSEVEHHHAEWMNSEHAPYNSDAGNDPKVHKAALSYLSTTNVPKEKHEKLAMHIADKFHGSGIGEETQIDELSKKTLSSYLNKKKSEYMKGKTQSGSKENAKDIQNMGKAHDKLNKEELELDEANKESKKDFEARQARLAAAGKETEKDPVRLKRLSSIPGYNAAMNLAKKTTKEEVELDEAGEVKTPKGLTVDTLAGPKKAPKGFEKDNEHTSAKVPLKTEGKRPESDTVPFVTDAAQSPKERLRAALGKVKKEMSNGY